MRPLLSVSLCPLCKRPVGNDEPYVLTDEHDLHPDFTLHGANVQSSVIVQRRFHVEHFRSRIGDHVYTLVDVDNPSR